MTGRRQIHKISPVPALAPDRIGEPVATTYTTNARLQKPGTADRGWDMPINANADALDGMAAIGGLAVTITESPSASLNVRAAAGTFVMADGTIGVFGGATSIPLPASATTYLWLSPTGVLTQGTSFPSAAHLRLAQVVTGATTVTKVIDQRVCFSVQGAGLGFVLKAGDTMSGPLAIVNATSNASVFSADPGKAVIGFFGVAPQAQAPALVPLIDATTGVAGGTIQNVGTSFSQSVLDNNFASLVAQVNALTAALKRHGLMST
jgi:hypothetical protein